jgi:hypothetical protein
LIFDFLLPHILQARSGESVEFFVTPAIVASHCISTDISVASSSSASNMTGVISDIIIIFIIIFYYIIISVLQCFISHCSY